MTPIQQLMLGVGASKKTYLDDVFNNYLWRGNSTDNRAINVGFNYTTDEGLVWIKNRQDTDPHCLFDTIRGAGKRLASNDNSGQTTTSVELKSFTSTGYTLGTDGTVNGNTKPFASWNFKSAPGFFDVVTWTGNGTARTIAHSLGSVPGMIMIKNLDSAENWRVYHKSLGATNRLILNSASAAGTTSTPFNDTAPTASVFSVGTDGATNNNGDEFVAYVFAGGESTAATARSVVFDGNDHLSLAASDDFHLTGDFTLEWWCKRTSDPGDGPEGIMEVGQYNVAGGALIYCYNSKFYINHGSDQEFALSLPPRNQWCHYAIVRSGSTVSLYMNGVKQGQFTDSNDWGSSSNKTFMVASNYGTNFIGNISNVRLVKGTAVYTSSFRPPTEPLTSISNTVLLCCNNSSTTGKTTGGTITANGDPTASTDSPFDDPAGFKFGDSKEGIIKCGSYKGNGSATGPEINLGFEPQWILIKNASASQGWRLFDSMRGIPTGGSDARLFPNNSDAESDAADYIDLTPTGFKLKDTGSDLNGDGDTLTYVAIRRPDGYVGKPANAGTDVFAMDTGNGNSNIPNFDSAFPVDFAWSKLTDSSGNWWTSARLLQGKELKTNNTDAEASGTNKVFDSNVGWHDSSAGSGYISHMWKRHAGFDVVTYEGDGVTGRAIPHSISKTPEMLWLKHRGSSSYNWMVYHKGLNGGTSPEDYYLRLNTNDAEASSSTYLNSTAPTSTHITLGSNNAINANGDDYIAMLFASVDGISKVGSYTGNASSSGPTITLGFAPRFIMLKGTTGATDWYVLDTLRGLASGDDKRISPNGASAQDTGDFIDPSSTGFQIVTDWDQFNGNNQTYLYYAHA